MAKVTESTASIPTSTANQRLVLCFDGTGNQFRGDRSDTNVVKIYSMLARDTDNQYHYYQPGIGTYVLGPVSKTRDTIKNGTEKLLDQMWGISFSDHVIAGYIFMMRYYTPNDDIYMFGFSRGAYTARFLAEMIDHIGLLSKGNEEMVGFAWRTYEQYMRSKPGSPEQEKNRKYMQRFRNTFCRSRCEVKFLGLFDCVNSTALFRDQFRAMIRPPARHIRHAVSIDEKRAKFRASLFDVSQASVAKWKSSGGSHSIEEKWFVGNHCNVGGGNRTDLRDEAATDPILSDIALSWMMKELLELHKLPGEENMVKLRWDNASVVELLNLGPDRDLVQVSKDPKAPQWFVTTPTEDLHIDTCNPELHISPVVEQVLLAREKRPYFYLDQSLVTFAPEIASDVKKVEHIKSRRKQQMVVDDMLSYSRNLYPDPSHKWHKRFFSTLKARNLTFLWNFMEHLPLARIELNNDAVRKEYDLKRSRTGSQRSDSQFLREVSKVAADPYAKWRTEYLPNRGDSRDLWDGASLHHSVLDRLLDRKNWDYCPTNINLDLVLKNQLRIMEAEAEMQATTQERDPLRKPLTQGQKEYLDSYHPKVNGKRHVTALGWIASWINPFSVVARLRGRYGPIRLRDPESE